jgi:hypothetical protein
MNDAFRPVGREEGAAHHDRGFCSPRRRSHVIVRRNGCYGSKYRRPELTTFLGSTSKERVSQAISHSVSRLREVRPSSSSGSHRAVT